MFPRSYKKKSRSWPFKPKTKTPTRCPITYLVPNGLDAGLTASNMGFLSTGHDIGIYHFNECFQDLTKKITGNDSGNGCVSLHSLGSSLFLCNS
jgi:hypothetical protein